MKSVRCILEFFLLINLMMILLIVLVVISSAICGTLSFVFHWYLLNLFSFLMKDIFSPSDVFRRTYLMTIFFGGVGGVFGLMWGTRLFYEKVYSFLNGYTYW